ncbi:hypothetical protein [Haliea sp.]|uniref:hypothetical protein n=1 Tax=Haliea sp. TaxID=1932666 RepID=UPI0025B8EBAC|nr:hypothetical protein [Haliea sp.]|tara:strand:+ start:4213 stop:4551 length:339 start_codon:yes stop_codon:yes gene_type:complete
MTINSNAQKWVDALRSGEYKQGVGQLYNQDLDKYCCLGVACKVYEKETGYNLGVDSGGTLIRYLQVKDWLSLRTICGDYINNSLVNLNDGDELSFSEIADVIESNPEGLFYD